MPILEQTGIGGSHPRRVHQQDAGRDRLVRAARCDHSLGNHDLKALGPDVPKKIAALEKARAEVDALYARWEELGAIGG